MKMPSSRPRSLLLAAGCSLLAVCSAYAQTTFTWDITPGTVGPGNGTITGGTGTWNTSNGNWTTDAGANNVAWVNAGAAPMNNAVFGGTAGTVTLGEAISIRNLSFTNTAGPYTITGSTLNFTAGTITASVALTGNGGTAAIIRSNITGAPALNIQPLDGDEQFTLNPVASGSMVIGAVTGDGGNGSEKLNLQGGAGSTGTIASVTGPKVLVSGGSWTINGASSGRNHEVSAGTLTLNANLNATLRAVILSGTGVLNYNVASAVSASAATNASTDNGFRITGGTLDQTSGAAINTNSSTTTIDLAGTLTFAGTNGALSNLHLGSGAVFLKGGNRTISVTNSAATLIVGGVIHNDSTPGRSLTKGGAGTLELRSNNTYTGATTVSAGTLAVNGSLANSATTVTSPTSARLQGSGLIVGPVTIGDNGTLAPGNSIESLGTGAVSFDANSTFDFEFQTDLFDGTPNVSADLVYSTGTLSIAPGALLTLTELGTSTALTPGSKLTLVSYSGSAPPSVFTHGGSPLGDGDTKTIGANTWRFSYADTSGGPNFAADQNGAGNFFTMTVVPEAGTGGLAALGLLLVRHMRRRVTPA
jgi:fibronectin-binding autotransporter adhesin